MARSRPATAPGLNDAAAAMVLADEGWAEKRGLKPAARLVAYGIAAVEPGMFGLGPVPAVRQALKRAGWEIGSIERAEINEAFAAIAIVVARGARTAGRDRQYRRRRRRPRPPDRRDGRGIDDQAHPLDAAGTASSAVWSRSASAAARASPSRSKRCTDRSEAEGRVCQARAGTANTGSAACSSRDENVR